MNIDPQIVESLRNENGDLPFLTPAGVAYYNRLLQREPATLTKEECEDFATMTAIMSLGEN